MDVIIIIALIILLIVALAMILSWVEHRKKSRLDAEKQTEQENALSRQVAKEKMQLAVVANHGEEPAESSQTDISDTDLEKIKAAYAKFEKDVQAWEAKLQVKPEFSADEENVIRKEQLKYRMYFEQAFYKKHGNSVASQEWRQWTDAFSGLLERHARLIAEDEPEPDDEDDEDEDSSEASTTEAESRIPSETNETEMTADRPSENNQTVEEHDEDFDTESLRASGGDVDEAETDRPQQETVAEKPDAENGNIALASIFPSGFTAADAPRGEVDEEELKGRERELWEYANRRNLSKREAGDRYERYLGYLYERAGWRVEYYGLTEGVANANRGIDLICEKDGVTHFVQTKYWSEGVVAKTNVNNVIDRIVKNMQGIIEKRAIRGEVHAVLAAKPKLSEQVAAYAQEQGVVLLDDLAVQPYPLVKCHTGKRGSRKYFLPYLADKNPAKYEEIHQGGWEPYDLVRMDIGGGDVYVHTIEEAEALGYKYSNR
ncbi:hypothetical protein [Neisseria sp. CCUG12390]|uniref:hypothetical protein n=1 Tax=Neisseria sp. CCUG12390 TaxID=3392035 RepID=UPI003A103498